LYEFFFPTIGIEHLDPQFPASRDDFPNGIDPFGVAADSVQELLFGPATISVHDDGNMPGKSGKIQLPDQSFFLASRRDKALEVFKHGPIIRGSS
jgi:hypothetical protein